MPRSPELAIFASMTTTKLGTILLYEEWGGEKRGILRPGEEKGEGGGKAGDHSSLQGGGGREKGNARGGERRTEEILKQEM